MPPRRILIVDDEDHIREVAGLALEVTECWKVSMLDSGRDVVQAAVGTAPDAILLDVMMPGLDGPGTLRLLKADPRTRSIPIIFLTAKVQSSDTQRLLELGVAGIIPKPFDPLTLGSEIAAMLRWT